MKQERILDALNGVDTAYLLDAAPTTQRSANRPLAAILSAAACLVLVIAGTVLLLGRGGPAPDNPGTAEPSDVALDASHTQPTPSVQQEPSAQQGEDNKGENSAVSEGPGEDTSRNVNTTLETLLSYRIGGLYLGMPREDLVAILGQPQDISNSGPVTLEDGITRVSWFYKLSDDPSHSHDLTVGLADAGDGWVVNELWVWADNGLALPNGIRIGMTNEELLAAWPELTQDFLMTQEDISYADGPRSDRVYMQYAGYDQYLALYLNDDRLVSLELAYYYPYPPVDLSEDTAPEGPYNFASGEITIWRYESSAGVWQATELTGKQAKRVETQCTIEELLPREPDDAAADCLYLLDFHNGTVALVYDEYEHGTAFRLAERQTLEAGLAAGSIYPEDLGLTDPTMYTFPQGLWALLEELWSTP